MTSLQNHPRPKWKNPDLFEAVLKHQKTPLFWGVKIPYMNRMGYTNVRSFWKELSTILEILKCNNLDDFLEENLRFIASHISTNDSDRSLLLGGHVIGNKYSKILHNPPPPNSTPLLPPTLNQAYHHSPTNHPTEHLFRVSQPCWESTPIPRQYNLHALSGGFQGQRVSRSVGGELLGTFNLRLQMCNT